MSNKVTREYVDNAIHDFADELGICLNEFNGIDHGQILKPRLIPVNESLEELETQITKETKKAKKAGVNNWAVYWGYGWGTAPQPEKLEATLLGKVNALAEFLGVEFEVTPEHVSATRVKAVAKKSGVKKTKVTAKKVKK
jgi:hypothetical protein